MSARTDLQLSQGFDAGNYASAYETTDYAKAVASLSMNRSASYLTAFTLGFFSSYEPHEMGAHEATYWAAYGSPAGKRCVALGFIDTHEPAATCPDCGASLTVTGACIVPCGA